MKELLKFTLKIALVFTLMLTANSVYSQTPPITEEEEAPNEDGGNSNFSGVKLTTVSSNTIVGYARNLGVFDFNFKIVKQSNGVWLLETKTFSNRSELISEKIRLDNLNLSHNQGIGTLIIGLNYSRLYNFNLGNGTYTHYSTYYDTISINYQNATTVHSW